MRKSGVEVRLRRKEGWIGNGYWDVACFEIAIVPTKSGFDSVII
jgi:hypothetical protein